MGGEARRAPDQNFVVGGMRSGGVEEVLERGLGLERTKGGADDKEHAYLVRRSNLSRLGICLITTAVVCLIVGLTLKSDLVQSFHTELTDGTCGLFGTAPRRRKLGMCPTDSDCTK